MGRSNEGTRQKHRDSTLFGHICNIVSCSHIMKLSST
jgi:hypothetical protein